MQGRSTWAGGLSEGVPAAVSPRAKAGALDGRPPWEVPLLGGPGILDAGKDRKSNAEITPLEVPGLLLHAGIYTPCPWRVAPMLGCLMI